MKKFLIDQSLFLLAGIAIMILIPFVYRPAFACVFEIIAVLSWGYLCRRILLLPLDLLFGKVTQTVYFSAQCSAEHFEFSKGKACCVWKFYSGDKQTLTLLAPIAATEPPQSRRKTSRCALPTSAFPGFCSIPWP